MPISAWKININYWKYYNTQIKLESVTKQNLKALELVLKKVISELELRLKNDMA